MPGAGIYVAPSLNHAGCVITTSGTFSFRFISATASLLIKSNWLMDVKVNVKPPRFSDKNRFTSSRPGAVLVAPIPARTKKQQTSNEGGWVLRSGRGQLRETKSTSAATPAAISRSTFPDSNDPTRGTISAFYNVTFTPSRSSTVRTLDRRTC